MSASLLKLPPSICVCGHGRELHDGYGCAAWDRPPVNDRRRRNPRHCKCALPRESIIEGAQAPLKAVR